MSVEVFCYRLGKTQLVAADKKGMPFLLEKYASTSVAFQWVPSNAGNDF